MSKKTWFYIAFFAALIFGFYYFSKDWFQPSSSKLAVINANIPAFNFTDQNNKLFSNLTTTDKVYVAEYFFTTCKGICPKMNANMRRVFDVYKNEPNFLIASYTCMPEVDSVPLMKEYERRMINGKLSQQTTGLYKLDTTAADFESKPIENKNWFFLTGDKAKLYELARLGYMIDNGKPDSSQIKDQFIHTQFFALIDKHNRLRGIYDGLKNNEVDNLIDDIKSLLNEKITTQRFVGGFSNNPN